MASNKTTLLDEDGKASDWIELHNTGPNSVDLQNWYLSDDDGDLTQWQFPSVNLGVDQYLVVFASNENRANSNSELHTNFKLGRSGEYLALVMPDGLTIATEFALQYPEQFDDISYGGNVFFPVPTPGAENSAGVASLEAELAFGLAHGFFESPQSLTMTSNLPNGTIRYTLDGRVPPNDFGCQAPSNGQPWTFQYYEGNFTSLPDFDSLTPLTTGTIDQVTTAVRERDENYALRFTGCITAPADGIYTFTTTSDDSSQLLIDGDIIVSNLSPIGTASTSNQATLDQGLHQVVITYFHTDGDHALAGEWTAPLRGRTFAATPDEGELLAADAGSNDFVEFEFDIEGNGDFSFLPSVQGPSAGSSSFWVQLNNGPLWLYVIPPSGVFSQVALNNNNSNIAPSPLTGGEHTLKFFVREDGARIDSLTVVGSNCVGPCQTQVLQAEVEDVSGDFILGGLDAEAIPAQGWFTYTAPIPINQTSTVRAIAIQQNFQPSDVQTQSYFFLDDVITQSSNEENPPGWPDGDVNFQDMDYGMDPEIVNPNPQAVKTSILSLPSISMVTDLDNLVHPEIGIYVNAEERGRAWERPASIELIDPQSNEPGFTIDAGVRIRGGFSRSENNPKHPFRLYFRGSYGGDLNYPLFGQEGVSKFDRMDLRSPNNYNWAFGGGDADGEATAEGLRNTFLREIWSRDTQAALGHPYTRSRYYHLFINGQYWGVNMTQERVTKHFASSYFGGKNNDYDVVKSNSSDNYRFEASDGTNPAWLQIWETVADQTISNIEYAALDQQVDLDNLIDYILGNAYEGDIDGAPSAFLENKRANNWYAVRDRVGARLKWSFFQHDGEHTLGARPEILENGVIIPLAEGEVVIFPKAPFDGQANEFYLNDYMNPYWLHAALTSNLEYQQRFKDRVAEVFAQGGVLSNEQGLARWLKRKAEVQAAILAHSARWGDAKRTVPLTVNDWQTEVNNVENNFFSNRAEIVIEQLRFIELLSEIELPTLSINSGTVVPAGTFVTVTPPANGTVYYTLDGSDPRAVGGMPAANALLLPSDGLIEIASDVTLTIRVLDDGLWSSIIIAEYQIGEDEFCFPIRAVNGNLAVVCL